MSDTSEAPKQLMELPGLDAIAWNHFDHAYGMADGTLHDLRYLISEDAGDRAFALHNLCISIFHQGSVYSSTSAALPFLLQVVANPAMPNRQETAELVAEISYSARLNTAEELKEAWHRSRQEIGLISSTSSNEELGSTYRLSVPSDEAFECEARIKRELYDCFAVHRELLRQLQTDLNSEIAQAASTILSNLEFAQEEAT